MTNIKKKFKSKYFSIDEFYKNVMKKLSVPWTRDEFIYALKILESLPIKKLKKLNEKLGASFSPKYDVKNEEYIDVILTEGDKEKIISELRKL